MEDGIQTQISYYVRLDYSQHITSLCLEHLQRIPQDPVLRLWHAFGLILEGSYTEALQQLRTLIDHRDIEFAALVATLYVYKLSPTLDIDETDSLERRLEAAERCGCEKGLVVASTLYSYIGGKSYVSKAKDLVAKILRVQPHYVPAQCLSGWVHLLYDADGVSIMDKNEQDNSLDRVRMEMALKDFDEVLVKENCLDAHLGKAYYYELKGEFAKALDELNQVTVLYSWFVPAWCEKARLGLLVHDWVLVQETAQLILQKDASNIEGLRMIIHVMLCNENDTSNAANVLDDLINSLEQKETRNANICLHLARPIARIAGRGRPLVLQKTLVLAERAYSLCPKEAIFAMEIAAEHFLLADYQAALQSYKLASQLDSLNLEAMYGAVQCLLVLGEIDEAEEQLEFLVEISYSTIESAGLDYLTAQLAWAKTKNYDQCRDLLVKIVDYQAQAAKRKHDYKFYAILDPDRILGVAHLLLKLSRYERKGLHVRKSMCLQKGVEILELLLNAIPGSLEGLLMLAEFLIQLEELEAAQCVLQTALGFDPSSSTGRILLTQVYVQLGNHQIARQSLEHALSDNFTVRDTLKYHVLNAQIHLQADQNEEALKVLESAMCLPGMKQRGVEDTGYYVSPQAKKLRTATDDDRVLVYLLQADVHMRLGHTPEATKVMQDALNQFSGTPEEMKIMIAKCDLALGRGDVNSALALLQQVPCSSNYYVQARMTVADIYMKHWHDKSRFVKCYMELVEMCPNAKMYILLGDALLKVDELEEAVKAYEAAAKESPEDGNVALQVGKFLVTTHNYAKAVEHYKSSLQNTDGDEVHFGLYYDLADLYFKLKHYEQAERVVVDMLAKGDNVVGDKAAKNTSTILLCLKGSLLLSKVQKVLGKPGTSTEATRRSSTESRYLPAYKIMFSAKSIQSKILSKLHGLNQDAIREQRRVAADIYFHFAKECEAQKDLEKTINLLHEALNCNSTHHPATLALARIYFSRGDVSECEQKCADILRDDPFNAEAGNILVHLMLYREMYESAIVHFKQNLDRDPNHYASLCQLIRLLRTSGQLDDIQPYVDKAEKASPTCTDAGLYYCKGLIARYSSNRLEALQMLNKARTDGEWGRQAIYLLIEGYLNIDGDFLLEESQADGSTVGNDDGIKAAWKLLGESRLLDGKSEKQLALECYATMATRQKADIEFALARLTEAFTRGEQTVQIMLGIATAWIFSKQPLKAKAQLRLIDRLIYKWEEGESFERAWLMLANIFIQTGKNDAAEELCRKCLKYNKDCARAWEYLGIIMETNHSFGEAVGYLESAWKCHREASPSVGYRLAFTYLKERRYIEAITVCHKVLKACSTYPRIKKDILDKARLCVRA